jgi:hypothetical protein
MLGIAFEECRMGFRGCLQRVSFIASFITLLYCSVIALRGLRFHWEMIIFAQFWASIHGLERLLESELRYPRPLPRIGSMALDAQARQAARGHPSSS